MAIKLKQSIKQSQSLAMTPQLRQAIQLLTLTHLEMTNVIADEMVENPLLEELEEHREEKNETDYKLEKLEGENVEAQAPDFDAKNDLKGQDDFDFDQYIENYNTHSSSLPPSMAQSSETEEGPNYENMISRGLSLGEHLEWQLRMQNLSKREWETAHLLIHNISDDGFLDIDLKEVCEKTKTPLEEGLAILKIIQTLDPVGCGSRDLAECLGVQAGLLSPRMPLVEKIIESALDLLEKRDLKAIATKFGVDTERVHKALEIIMGLNPKPGRLISQESTHYIVPDIYVRDIGGELKIEVNNEGVPPLRISKIYQNILGQKDSSSKEYVKEKLRNALWLLKSIHNRQSTIYRVAQAIVTYQPDFFRKGPAFLKPMILKDIAGEIGVHESTVSRVTSNKYMHTPLGIFELKYFFNVGIGGKNEGLDLTGESLKLKIKEIIDQENPQKPLSDQKIVDLLRTQDMVVARRTVTKYREQLHIPSSSKRKRK
ncbi:MAG: RNA polymerase factor sigma-54 [Bacteriovoracales bacterium]|nr:RNA polymerase factor sigma-54 [Bacteriovoracales bacterium]